MWASVVETYERFREETREHFYPADPGDVRFEHGMAVEGMEETPFWLKMIDDTGRVVETHFFAEREGIFSLIGAHREAQERRAEAERLGVHPLEIALAPFGPEWEREQAERNGGRF